MWPAPAPGPLLQRQACTALQVTLTLFLGYNIERESKTAKLNYDKTCQGPTENHRNRKERPVTEQLTQNGCDHFKVTAICFPCYFQLNWGVWGILKWDVLSLEFPLAQWTWQTDRCIQIYLKMHRLRMRWVKLLPILWQMNISYHKEVLEHPQSSSHSEATADSKTQLEIALKENPWASIVNEPMLMRLNLKESQSTVDQPDPLLFSLLLKLPHKNKWALKETASYYVKKANKQWK